VRDASSLPPALDPRAPQLPSPSPEMICDVECARPPAPVMLENMNRAEFNYGLRPSEHARDSSDDASMRDQQRRSTGS